MASCLKKLKTLVVTHWTVHQEERSAEQKEAEKYLLTICLGNNRFYTSRAIAFNRWYLFMAAFFVQFCIGSAYAWSVFNKPIDTLLFNDPTAEKAVITFYIAVAFIGTTTAIMGPWVERNGPRKGMLLGTCLFLFGMFLSGVSLHFKSIIGLYIGYGFFCGCGIGLTYISPVSALQKWFPDCRGTAAGFAVGGYGAGSLVWGKVYLPVMHAVGLPSAFFVLGGIMCFVMYSCAIVLRLPPDDYVVNGVNIQGQRVSCISIYDGGLLLTPSKCQEEEKARRSSLLELGTKQQKKIKESHQMTLIQSIQSPDFIFLYLMFFANQLFGLMVLSKLAGLCTDLFGKTPEEGATAVAITSTFNCIGRLFLPMLSDGFIRFFKWEPAFTRKMLFLATLTIQVVVIATLPTLIRHQEYWIFLLQVWLLTLAYGAGFGVIPCFLADMFGAYNIGSLHGLILTSWSIGGVGGGMAFNALLRHYIKSDHLSPRDAYISIFNTLLIVLLVGFVSLFFVRTNPTDRFAQGVRYQFSLCNKPILRIPQKQKKQQEVDDDDDQI